MNRISALLLLLSGLAVAATGAMFAPMVALPLWFLAQIALDFGWAALIDPREAEAQIAPQRLLLWLGWLAAAAAVLLLVLGLPLMWLNSGGGLAAFLATSGIAAGSVFISRREHAYAAQILFGPSDQARLPALLRHLRTRMWDRGDPVHSFWSAGFWINLSLLLGFLGALTVCTPAFRMQTPWPQLGFVLLLVALSLWRVDRLLASLQQPADETSLLPVAGFGAEDEVEMLSWDEQQPTEAETSLDLDAELIDAVRRVDAQAVSLLLQRGARPDAEPAFAARDLRSALVSAATCGQPGILRLLIAAGADLNRMSHGLNPLLAATRDCYDGRPDVVLMLLSNGANPTVTDATGATPLHYAALSHDPAVAQHLLDAKAPLEALDREQRTALGRAAQAGNLGIVDLLLKAGARLEPESGKPVLLLAASGLEDEVAGVRRLLETRARVDATDSKGRTALHSAAEHDHAAIAELLLAAGARVDALDSDGHSPAMVAARHGAKRVLRRLLVWKADPALVDPQGRGCLHLAALSTDADTELIDLLLALGCDPLRQDLAGQTAFELAMAEANWDVARRLNPQASLPDALQQVSETRDLSGDRAALVIQSLAQQRRAVALELLALGPLPPAALAEAARVAADQLDGELLAALRQAGLNLASTAAGEHLLVGLCAQRPLPQTGIAALLAAGASRKADSQGQSPLALLCGAGEEPPTPGEAHAVARFVQSLVSDRSLLELADASGRTPLSFAVQHSSAEVVALLLDAGADPNHADRHGRTCLHQLLLCRRPDAELLVRALILAGADPARPAVDGCTPAGLALLRDQYALMPLLAWPAGAHPGRPLRGADLASAAQRADLQVIELLLTLGLPIDGVDDRGASAALHAAGRGDLELLLRLHDAGANLRLAAANGTTPFGAAALSGRHATLRWLAEIGIEVDAPQARKLTALALAAASGDGETLDLLLDLGASPDHVQAESSPARIALRGLLSGSVPAEHALPALAALLEAGADPNQVDDEGRSLLLLALGAGQTIAPLNDGDTLHELVALLHQHGAELNLPDRQGRTALHWVCRHGLMAAATQLVELGADPDMPDDLRKLPIDLASARNRSELHALFRSRR